MGIFGNSKESAGVRKNGAEKKRIFLGLEIYFRKFWKLCLLNLIYILFCLPVITIGPATAGVTYVLRNFSREQPGFLWYDFWSAFKSNFKQSFVMGIINIIVYGAGAFGAYIYFLRIEENRAFLVLFIASLLLLVLYSIFNYYTYLVMVTVELKLSAILKNSFIFTVLGIKDNFFAWLINAAFIFLELMFFPITLLVILPIGFITPLFVKTFAAYPTVKKYCIDPMTPEDDEEKIFSDELLDSGDSEM
ncbi:MAG: YesL family protein [Oscillospiraceae bacterium]|nr:YesL family protein [Oscillospiraceae bacterium]MBQ3050113.1 YesL family protein [Oscillospiraceae bacterium]MBQ9939083.1 YesL family protein [Oscillospiraceae bacterium]